jgi:hypothetical protein
MVMQSASRLKEGRGARQGRVIALIGTTINGCLKPHLVRSTFHSCRADAIEGSQRLWAMSGIRAPRSND